MLLVIALAIQGITMGPQAAASCPFYSYRRNNTALKIDTMGGKKVYLSGVNHVTTRLVKEMLYVKEITCN